MVRRVCDLGLSVAGYPMVVPGATTFAEAPIPGLSRSVTPDADRAVCGSRTGHERCQRGNEAGHSPRRGDLARRARGRGLAFAPTGYTNFACRFRSFAAPVPGQGPS